MTKKLPLGIPALRSDATRATTSAIITVNQNSEKWLFNNNIGVRLALDVFFRDNDLNFNTITPAFSGAVPFLEHQSFYKYLLNDADALLNTVKHAINNEYYIECNLDNYYIPNRYSYQKMSFFHQELLIGFDDKKEELYLAGFSQDRKFEESTITYEQFKQAIAEVQTDRNSTNKLHFVRFKPEEKYDYDIKRVKKMLQEYLCSKNLLDNLYEYFDCTKEDPSEKYFYEYNTVYKKENFVFGMNCYDYILAYFRDSQINNSFKRPPVNSLVALCNHKESMLFRIDVFFKLQYICREKRDEIYKDYKENVCNPCYLILNNWLKYEVTGNYSCIERIIKYISKIKENEYNILNLLLDAVSV